MVAVFALDNSQQCRFLNAVAEVMTGMPLARARDMPFRDLVWRDNPVSFEDTGLGRILIAGDGGEGEETFVGRDRVRRLMAFRVAPLGLDEPATIVELVDLSGEAATVRALRESEQRLRLAVEATEVGTWDYDVVTGEHRWSDQFKKLWGLSMDAPSDPAVLRPLIGQKDWELALDRWRSAAAHEGDPRIAVEVEIRRADDGARRWCSFAGQIFFDESRMNPIRAVGIMIDATDRKEVAERQRLILREMNHRVKNSLAVVQAVVSQTIRMTPNPEEAFERIQSRLMAISRTHDFLDRHSSGEASLGKLIGGELESFADGNPGRVTLNGPLVVLESASILALGLTFHELVMNSLKYGALSGPEGRLEVSWRVEGAVQPVVEITWIERGGPVVRSPGRAGFGSRLIEGSVGGNLGGSVEVEYAPAGIRARLSFPLRPLVPVDEL